MRKAHDFISAEFWPESAQDIQAVARAFPSPENTYMRQVTTYWEMAAAMVLRGALHEGLFFDCSGEMYCVYAKFLPYLPEIRQKLPKMLVIVEELVLRSEEGRARLERLEARLKRAQQKLAQRRAAIAATSAGYIGRSPGKLVFPRGSGERAPNALPRRRQWSAATIPHGAYPIER